MRTPSDRSCRESLRETKGTLEVTDNKLPDLWSLHYSYCGARCLPTSGSGHTLLGLPSICREKGTDWKCSPHYHKPITFCRAQSAALPVFVSAWRVDDKYARDVTYVRSHLGVFSVEPQLKDGAGRLQSGLAGLSHLQVQLPADVPQLKYHTGTCLMHMKVIACTLLLCSWKHLSMSITENHT